MEGGGGSDVYLCYSVSFVLVLLARLLFILVDVSILYGIFESLLVEYQLVFQVLEVIVRKVESFAAGEVAGRRKERGLGWGAGAAAGPSRAWAAAARDTRLGVCPPHLPHPFPLLPRTTGSTPSAAPPP